RSGTQQTRNFVYRGGRIPELERASLRDLARVCELRSGFWWPERAPRNVVVELIQRMFSDPSPFSFRIVGNDSPLTCIYPTMFWWSPLSLQRGQVRGLMRVLCTKKAITDSGDALNRRFCHCPNQQLRRVFRNWRHRDSRKAKSLALE